MHPAPPLPMPVTRPLHLAVVDPDDVSRTGSAILLRRRPEIGLVIGFTHDQALAHERWHRVDLLLLDPADPHRAGDQVPGAALVVRIRAVPRREPLRIVVISRLSADDAVRRRLIEAGADAYVHRSQIYDADELCRVLLDTTPATAVPEPVDAVALERLGVTARSRVNAGVAAAFAEQLVPDGKRAGTRVRHPLGRRLRFNQAARLRAVAEDSHRPPGEHEVPSIGQIQRFVAWATRVEPVPARSAAYRLTTAGQPRRWRMSAASIDGEGSR